MLKYAPKAIDKPELGQAMAFDNQVFKSSKTDAETGGITYDVDYEVVDDEPKEAPKNVDKETREVLEDDFFGEGFEPVEDDK